MAEEKKVDDAVDKQDDKKKTGFDADQQLLINELIDKSYTKAFAKADETRKTEVAALKAEIDELKKLQKPADKTDDDKKDKKDDKKKPEESDDMKALRAQLEELKAGVTGLKGERDEAKQRATEVEKATKKTTVKERFFEQADKFEFFDRTDVWKLTEDQFDLNDEGDVVIINPATKAPRKNADLNDLSLQEFLSDFAKKKPQMVRSKDSKGGTDAGESRKVDTKESADTLPDFSKMSTKEFNEYTTKVVSKQYERR